jgi:hypothetical protein
MRFLVCYFLIIFSTSYLFAQHEGEITVKSRVHKSNQIYVGIGYASPHGTENYFGGLSGELGYLKHLTPILSLGASATTSRFGIDNGSGTNGSLQAIDNGFLLVNMIGADLRINFIADSKKKNWQGYLLLKPLFGFAKQSVDGKTNKVEIANQNFGGIMIGPGIEYSHPNSKISFYGNLKYLKTSKIDLSRKTVVVSANDEESESLSVLIFTAGVLYKF